MSDKHLTQMIADQATFASNTRRRTEDQIKDLIQMVYELNKRVLQLEKKK